MVCVCSSSIGKLGMNCVLHYNCEQMDFKKTCHFLALVLLANCLHLLKIASITAVNNKHDGSKYRPPSQTNSRVDLSLQNLGDTVSKCGNIL